MKDRIILSGMEFIGHHGCTEAERKNGQKFLVDIELYLDLSKAGVSDRLGDSVDYVKIFGHAKHAVCEMEYNLIETVAESIADNILVDFDNISRVNVKVTKSAPIEIGNFNAAVSITRFKKHD